MSLSDWINVLQAILLLCIIPGGIWALSKVTAYFAVVATLQVTVARVEAETKTKILLIEQAMATIQVNCGRHQKWMEDVQRGQRRIDRNLIRVCAKLEIQGHEDETEESQA
jgi:hypothetical protein